jgi:hypothetical protein
MKFRKKPVVIEAIQFQDTAATITAISDFTNQTIKVNYGPDSPTLTIPTLEGDMTANVGDWIIRGVKGEFYPCKPDIFAATYEQYIDTPDPQPIACMSFGEAICALKRGLKVCRAGWNGKGMWLALSPGQSELPAENFWAGPNREYAASNGGSACVFPCITMKTATGEILMGWLASQTDMLAEDWMIVE